MIGNRVDAFQMRHGADDASSHWRASAWIKFRIIRNSTRCESRNCCQRSSSILASRQAIRLRTLVWAERPSISPGTTCATRAIVRTQQALVADVTRATEVGKKLFPADDANLIADVVERDLPYYDATISETFVKGMNDFMIDLGWLDGPVPYEQVVATSCIPLWTS